jgi:ABC-type phosphate transport system substrate-binding protein
MLLVERMGVPTAPVAPCCLPCHVFLLITGLLRAWPSHGAIRDRIIIVGSSTVYPFSALVAEHFAKSGPFSAPVIHATSTAEGIRLFCAGVGGDAPDISNASRPISDAERASCEKNGVKKITGIRIGYDSLILANAIGASTSRSLSSGERPRESCRSTAAWFPIHTAAGTTSIRLCLTALSS